MAKDNRNMRELLTARLKHKLPLSTFPVPSGASEAFHLTFEVEKLDAFPFQAGQFISCVAEDPATGKQQTRAYSLASAPAGNRFDLCLNRVADGFFSNLLCNLEVGDAVQWHGPHGYFTLQPAPSHALLIATGTGIAPIRGLLQELFQGKSAESARQVWLVQGPDVSSGELGHPADPTLYYRDEFEALAARHANFEYRGTAGGVLNEVAALLPALAAEASPAVEHNSQGASLTYAYVCGLRAMVAPVRKLLQEHGWAKQQVLSERYD